MPKIPIYERSVAPAALPDTRSNVRATGASFGAGNAQDVQSVGDSAFRLGAAITREGQRLRREKEKTEVRDVYNQADEAMRKTLTPFYQLQGGAADGVYGRGQVEAEKIRKKYSKNLKTQEQLDMFNASFDRLARGYDNKLIGHEATQMEKYRVDTLDAENKNAIDNAVVNRYDARAIGESEFTIVQNTNAKYRGYEGVIADEMAKKARTLLHTSVMDGLMSDSPSAAWNYFKRNEKRFSNPDLFDPAVFAAIKPTLEKKAEEDVIRQTAIRISNSGMSLEAQLEAADKIEDSSIGSAVRAKVKQRYADKTAAKTAKENAYFDAEWKNLVQNPTLYEIPYPRLRNDQWSAMEKYRSNFLQKKAGFRTSTDMNLWSRLSVMPDPQFKEIPIGEMIGYMSSMEEKRWNPLFERYRKLQLGQEPDQSFTSVQSTNQMVNTKLEGIGVDLGKDASDKNKTKSELFRRRFQIELENFEAIEGRKARPTEREKIADELLIEGEIDGTLWDPNKRLYELSPEDLETFEVFKVPPSESKAIIAALEADGTPVTNKAIRDLYTKKLLRGRK